MDILSVIDKFNNEIDEKKVSEYILYFENNYISYFNNISKVTNDRKLIQSLNILSRKGKIKDYILNDKILLEMLYKYQNSDDVKIRKNVYSIYFNLGFSLDAFLGFLDGELSYINVLHLLDIISKFDNVDVGILENKLNTIDKSDANYEKAKKIIDTIKLKSRKKCKISDFLPNDKLLLTTSSVGVKVLINDLNAINVGVLHTNNLGVVVSGANTLKDLLKVRSYYEILITKDTLSKNSSSTDIANSINQILDINYFNRLFLDKTDKYTYRIEIKGVDAKDRIKLSREILSNIVSSDFVNIRDDYDFEVRVEFVKDKIFISIKVPYEDNRFEYRINELPASINPVTASIIAGLIKPYIIKCDNVLDGFVGTGTMLYEYYLRVQKGNFVGVDIEKNAINMARENIKSKIPNLKLVNSDIIKYKPKDKFDVIISNMPFGTRVLKHDAILRLYHEFSIKLDEIMSNNGRAFLLTTNGKAIKDALLKNNYNILREFRVESGGLIPFLIVVEKKR